MTGRKARWDRDPRRSVGPTATVELSRRSVDVFGEIREELVRRQRSPSVLAALDEVYDQTQLTWCADDKPAEMRRHAVLLGAAVFRLIMALDREAGR